MKPFCQHVSFFNNINYCYINEPSVRQRKKKKHLQLCHFRFFNLVLCICQRQSRNDSSYVSLQYACLSKGRRGVAEIAFMPIRVLTSLHTTDFVVDVTHPLYTNLRVDIVERCFCLNQGGDDANVALEYHENRKVYV